MQSIKSNYTFNLKHILLSIVLCACLLLSNVIGLNTTIYSTFDTILHPFFISTRSVALNSSFFLREITAKRTVLNENIALRRDILKYEEIKTQNKELQDQIKKLESQTKITAPVQKDFQMAKVIGIQNLFTSNPQVMVRLGEQMSNLKENSPVYYETNTLFGFVSKVEGKTVLINPFYSPNIDSKIPVQSLTFPQQKGFISAIEDGVVKIKNLPKDYKLQEGEVWVTTNDVVEVPPSLIVGKVKSIKINQQDGFQEVELELPFTLSTISYLLLEK